MRRRWSFKQGREEPDNGEVGLEGDGSASQEIEVPFYFSNSIGASQLALISLESSNRIRAVGGMAARGGNNEQLFNQMCNKNGIV